MSYLSWVPRWYYILKNITSGKLYFGQRKRDDIGTKYLGSGTYWKNHCKKNGGYSSTNIVVLWKGYYDSEENANKMIADFERKEGQYWLEENKKWANQCPENTLNNPFYGPYINQKYRDADSCSAREKKKVEAGTHVFLGGEVQRTHGKRINQERVKNGTHNLLSKNGGSELARNTAKKRLQEGTHHFQDDEYKKKMNDITRNRIEAGVHNFVSDHPSLQKWKCVVTGIVSTKSGFTQRAKNSGLNVWPHELERVEN